MLGHVILCFCAFLIYCRDGKLLIGGGRSRYLHVWSLESQSLLRVIELPRKVTSVHQLDFLPCRFEVGSDKVSYNLHSFARVRYFTSRTPDNLESSEMAGRTVGEKFKVGEKVWEKLRNLHAYVKTQQQQQLLM